MTWKGCLDDLEDSGVLDLEFKGDIQKWIGDSSAGANRGHLMPDLVVEYKMCSNIAC
jgi:hypothetical protein